MANADFSQNRNPAPGGFDAGSYREKAKPEQAVTLTPRQQKLAALEAKLPAALSTRAAALALSVVVMLAAFFGFGSAKLRGKYNTARQWFTAGVAADNGYNLSEELTTRENTAANIITTAAAAPVDGVEHRPRGVGKPLPAEGHAGAHLVGGHLLDELLARASAADGNRALVSVGARAANGGVSDAAGLLARDAARGRRGSDPARRVARDRAHGAVAGVLGGLRACLRLRAFLSRGLELLELRELGFSPLGYEVGRVDLLDSPFLKPLR